MAITTGGQIAVALCSLGSAVCPAGPAERAADREAIAAIMASTLIAPRCAPFPPDLRAAIAAVAVDLRSGHLDDLDALAIGLDDLAVAAQRRSPTTPSDPDARNARNYAGTLLHQARPAHPARVALAAAAALALLGGAGSIAAGRGTERPLGRAGGEASSASCSRPAVPRPRVDPDGSGCGQPAGFRSPVLMVGTARWSLGPDILDGRLVDLDDDGWSELAVLRNDGEVFLVRRFPDDASEAISIRSVANAPKAARLAEAAPGAGIEGLRAIGTDGTPSPVMPVAAGAEFEPRAAPGPSGTIAEPVGQQTGGGS